MNTAIENYLADQLPEHQEILYLLRSFVLEAAPGVVEEYKWKTPFYSYQGLLCYLNVDRKRKQVYLGFYRGAELSNQQRLLEGEGKLVRLIYFSKPEDTQREAVREILLEAMWLNEQKREK